MYVCMCACVYVYIIIYIYIYKIIYYNIQLYIIINYYVYLIIIIYIYLDACYEHYISGHISLRKSHSPKYTDVLQKPTGPRTASLSGAFLINIIQSYFSTTSIHYNWFIISKSHHTFTGTPENVYKELNWFLFYVNGGVLNSFYIEFSIPNKPLIPTSSFIYWNCFRFTKPLGTSSTYAVVGIQRFDDRLGCLSGDLHHSAFHGAGPVEHNDNVFRNGRRRLHVPGPENTWIDRDKFVRSSGGL